jgi:AcrR family transcriptional regulator
MNESPDTLFDREPPVTARMLKTAHRLIFQEGYPAFTMDELAHELGMSKKTLYVHFPGKDALVGRIIDLIGARMWTRMEAVIDDRKLDFTQKVAGVVAVAGTTLGKVSPAMLRELQRFAPDVYQKIEELRSRTIPVVFGRLIRDGIAEGKVRADVDPAFAVEFWLQAIRGLAQPAVLERTQLTLPQTLDRALHIFFSGLLTPTARKDYEKHS